jgi:hypothetical protein
MNENKVSQHQRKAKSEKYKLFEEPVYSGIMKDVIQYDNVTQCEDAVSRDEDSSSVCQVGVSSTLVSCFLTQCVTDACANSCVCADDCVNGGFANDTIAVSLMVALFNSMLTFSHCSLLDITLVRGRLRG